MTHWIIEHRDGEYTSLRADRCRFDSGWIIFENGNFLESTLILALGPHSKAIAVQPVPEDMECTNPAHDHDEDDD